MNKCKVYADSNFLISYWIRGHDNYNIARMRFFELIEKNVQFFISPLVIDECWYKIYKIWKDHNRESQKSFNEFYQEFRELLDFIISSSFFTIIQLGDDLCNGCKEALENIKIYNFRPHDAFHLAMMKDNQIFSIITKDSDFTKQLNQEKLQKQGFQIISF